MSNQPNNNEQQGSPQQNESSEKSKQFKDNIFSFLIVIAFIALLISTYFLGYRAGYKSQEFISNTIDKLEKPVVYFYPTENDTKISYTTRASRDFTVSYPSYNNGWHFTANTDGTLTVDNRQYNYLYWEAQNAKFIDNISTRDGWIIPSSEVTTFLEEKLTYMGLNEKEQSDFISYWLPTLTSKSYVYIKFANDEFEEYVSPIVKPRPDEHIYVYMICEPLDTNNYTVKPQNLLPKQRRGFTVVEWGGTNISHTGVK